tara:strand:- start:4814 stop:5119 length:306 start_codon:yes stop_codon:yes gene_type:complete
MKEYNMLYQYIDEFRFHLRNKIMKNTDDAILSASPGLLEAQLNLLNAFDAFFDHLERQIYKVELKTTLNQKELIDEIQKSFLILDHEQRVDQQKKIIKKHV